MTVTFGPQDLERERQLLAVLSATRGVYPVRVPANGADVTQALEDAVAAAMETGGVVKLPAGDLTLTRPLTMLGSGALGEQSVYIRGDGIGVTRILWSPANPAANPFTWGNNVEPYYGGGASDFTLYAPTGDALTGTGLVIKDTVFNSFQNLLVRNFRAGTGFKTVNVLSCQNLHMANCQFQQCLSGMDVAAGAAQFYNVMLNQCLGVSGVIRGGTLYWSGGMIQGPTLEIRPTSTNGVNVTMKGIWHEFVDAAAPCVKAFAASGDTFGGRVSLESPQILNIGPTQKLLDADFYGVYLANILLSGPVLKARRSSLTAIDCNPTAAFWDLDASTARSSTFINDGNISIGQTHPNHPDLGAGSFFLPTWTTGTRPASPTLGCFGLNTTTSHSEWWNGTTWVT